MRGLLQTEPQNNQAKELERLIDKAMKKGDAPPSPGPRPSLCSLLTVLLPPQMAWWAWPLSGAWPWAWQAWLDSSDSLSLSPNPEGRMAPCLCPGARGCLGRHSKRGLFVLGIRCPLWLQPPVPNPCPGAPNHVLGDKCK